MLLPPGRRSGRGDDAVHLMTAICCARRCLSARILPVRTDVARPWLARAGVDVASARRIGGVAEKQADEQQHEQDDGENSSSPGFGRGLGGGGAQSPVAA